MENMLLKKENKKSFLFFEAALACLLFIVLNFVFMQAFYQIPASTISGNIVISASVSEDNKNYSVTEISDEAFYACSKIQSVTLPNTIKKIGKSSFAGTGILSIYIPSSVEKISAPSIVEAPFYAVSSNMVIYLEAEAVPETFDALWNYRTTDEPLIVKYGYTYEEYLADANLVDADLSSTNDAQVKYIFNSENNTATAIKGAEGFSRTNDIVYYVASFLISAVFGLTAFLVAKMRKVDFLVATGMKKKINWKIVGYSALLSIASLYGFSGLTGFFADLLSFMGYTSSSPAIEMPNFGIYLIFVLVSCMTPAFFEEILFRGTIQSGLNQFGQKISILVSALVFMLMHGTPDQTVHQFIIGVLIGFVFFKSGNLWLGVLIHFFNNFIAVTQMYVLQPFIDQDAPLPEITAGSLIWSFISSVITAVLVFGLVRWLVLKLLEENKKLNGDRESENNEIIQANISNSTIVVNGEEQEVKMTISGEPATEVSKSIEEEARQEFENDELFAEIQKERKAEEESKKQKKPEVTLPAILMFGCSVGYLVLQWLLALVSGL